MIIMERKMKRKEPTTTDIRQAAACDGNEINIHKTKFSLGVIIYIGSVTSNWYFLRCSQRRKLEEDDIVFAMKPR